MHFKTNHLHFESVLVVLMSVLLGVRSDVSDLNRVFFKSQPSGYIYPQPPVQFDEPASLPPLYLPPLPPVFSDEITILPTPYPPPLNYLPPSSAPVYLPPPSNDVFPPVGAQLPPIIADDDSVVISTVSPQNGGLYPPSQGLLPPQFKIENMSCTQGINFRATFKLTGDLPQFPVVDDANEGCITPLSGNSFKIDLDNFNNMIKCGVRRCKGRVIQGKSDTSNLGVINSNVRSSVQESENMCVVLRMPTVRGVRLPEDKMVTLVCIPQERVVSQTRHVKLGTNKIIQNARARSTNGLLATGGTQKDLKTKISIFRKQSGTNTFDENVQPDSVIQLGEDLVLRAVINDGDGWKSSLIGPVLISGLNSKKSALLVNQHGCVNPVMKSICPRQPQKLNPLCTELHFRAFLFQESPQGDDMVVSVRMQGCLHPQDCIRNDLCNEDPTIARSKRELTKGTSDQNHTDDFDDLSKEVRNWESQLTFRVKPLSTKRNTKNLTKEDLEYLYLFYLSLTVLLILSIIVAIFLVWYLWSKKFQTKENNSI